MYNHVWLEAIFVYMLYITHPPPFIYFLDKIKLKKPFRKLDSSTLFNPNLFYDVEKMYTPFLWSPFILLSQIFGNPSSSMEEYQSHILYDETD